MNEDDELLPDWVVKYAARAQKRENIMKKIEELKAKYGLYEPLEDASIPCTVIV